MAEGGGGDAEVVGDGQAARAEDLRGEGVVVNGVTEEVVEFAAEARAESLSDPERAVRILGREGGQARADPRQGRGRRSPVGLQPRLPRAGVVVDASRREAGEEKVVVLDRVAKVGADRREVRVGEGVGEGLALREKSHVLVERDHEAIRS